MDVGAFVYPRAMAGWTFLTNHAVVLIYIARNPGARLRDIAAYAGITERAVQQIVRDLADAGYLTATRVGRRNQYTVHADAPLRHPTQRHHDVGDLLKVLTRGVAAQKS
jgi:DNA-binding Lrp family transcriptional regulator